MTQWRNWMNWSQLWGAPIDQIWDNMSTKMSFLGGTVIKNLPANAGNIGIQIPSLGQEDFPGGGNGNPSSIIA